jgi:hypothetical protein
MAAGGSNRRGNSPWSSATANAQRPRPESDAGLRFLEWAVFGVMVLLLAVLAGLPAMTEAANPAPSLALTLATGPAGSVVTASGANFGHATVQLTWDGSANGMPSLQVGGNGSFKTTFTIPSTAATGPHQVQASGTSAGGSTNAGGKKNSTTLVSASAIFTVAISSSTSTSTATPAPTSAAGPTPTSPSASSTPAPTTAPTASPTAAATPTPKPTSTPTPTATQTASITANPTSITSGGTTTISGVGMPGSSAVLVFAGSGNFTTTSTGSGTFSLPIDIESATSGPQTVTATSGTISASTVVQLTVTATPTPTPIATPTPTPTPTATLAPTAAGKPVLKSGPARVGYQLLGAGQTMTGGTIDAQGKNVAVEMRDNSTLDGVEIFNTSASYGGGIYVQGNGVNIHDVFIHNTGNDGININRDGDPNGGIKNLTITNVLIQDTGGDSIHIKGTNRGDGQAPTQAAAMENIRITYTKSLRSHNTAPPGWGWGFEFQDGQLNCYFAYNDSDHPYSVVGHTGLQMLNNTVETTEPWGFEVGNMIGSTWDNNTATGATEAGFAFTGNTVTSNKNSTYSNNRVSGGGYGFELSNGSYNTFTNNGFHNVGEWFHNNGNYDQSHDVTTGAHAY